VRRGGGIIARRSLSVKERRAIIESILNLVGVDSKSAMCQITVSGHYICSAFSTTVN